MTPLNKKYFDDTDFDNISDQFKCDPLLVTLMSTDDYSDQAISDSIKQTGKTKELCAAAYQMCIIGFGNKNYGKVRFGNTEIDIKSLFLSTGVKLEAELGTKLSKGDLTPRRIQRFFRKYVFEYLSSNIDLEPYLYRKYSVGLSAYRSVTYPGAEHYVEDLKSLVYLLHTYFILDSKLGTNISERIMRVLIARKKLTQVNCSKLLNMFKSYDGEIPDFEEFYNIIG